MKNLLLIIIFFYSYLSLCKADDSLRISKVDSCERVINIMKKDRINDVKKDNVFFNTALIQSLLSSIIGSLLGAGLAIPCGLWLDRKIKGKQSKELIRNINKLLSSELDSNKERLLNYLNSNMKNTKLPNINFAAWQVALGQNYLAHCGNIELNNSLTNSYGKLYYIEKLSNSYYDLLILGQVAMPSYTDKLQLITEALNIESKNAIDLIKNSLKIILQYELHS